MRITKEGSCRVLLTMFPSAGALSSPSKNDFMSFFFVSRGQECFVSAPIWVPKKRRGRYPSGADNMGATDPKERPHHGHHPDTGTSGPSIGQQKLPTNGSDAPENRRLRKNRLIILRA